MIGQLIRASFKLFFYIAKFKFVFVQKELKYFSFHIVNFFEELFKYNYVKMLKITQMIKKYDCCNQLLAAKLQYIVHN